MCKFTSILFNIYGLQCDQLPNGLIAQLVEHCTRQGRELKSRLGLNFVQALISVNVLRKMYNTI